MSIQSGDGEYLFASPLVIWTCMYISFSSDYQNLQVIHRGAIDAVYCDDSPVSVDVGVGIARRAGIYLDTGSLVSIDGQNLE